MNQRPTGLNVTKAITGFLQYKSAEGLSPVTVTKYYSFLGSMSAGGG